MDPISPSMPTSKLPESTPSLPPCSPSALSGLTFANHHEDIELGSRDEEAQEAKPKRANVLGKLHRMSAGLSFGIPPHWKPGAVNERREYRPVDEYPDGFPRFAAWMNCDVNFLLARRYGWLHTRVMMFRQSELHDLEVELNAIDEQLLEEDDTDALADHQSFAFGEAGKVRTKLMQRIDDKLEEYGMWRSLINEPLTYFVLTAGRLDRDASQKDGEFAEGNT